MTDRAVSTTLNYVLSLGVATLLITGLLIAGGNFVEDRRDTVIRSEMEVIGEQVASDLSRMDRLALVEDGASNIRMNHSLPRRVTGSSYRITLESSPQAVVLNTSRPHVSVRVEVTTETSLAASSADGGFLVVRYDDGADELEVSNG